MHEGDEIVPTLKQATTIIRRWYLDDCKEYLKTHKRKEPEYKNQLKQYEALRVVLAFANEHDCRLISLADARKIIKETIVTDINFLINMMYAESKTDAQMLAIYRGHKECFEMLLHYAQQNEKKVLKRRCHYE